MIAWLNSSDGQEGINRPKPITSALFGTEGQTADYEVFEDADAFEEERRRILEEL